MEKWKTAYGQAGFYEVSDSGQVRSLLGITPKVVRGYKNSDGYQCITLCSNRRRVTWRICRLILTSFIGEAPPLTECAHLDGDITNNKLSNLKWVSHRENMAHKKIHGTSQVGEKHGMHILSESDVVCIRKRLEMGDSNKSIAIDFGVSNGAICMIATGRSWRYLGSPPRKPTAKPRKLNMQKANAIRSLIANGDNTQDVAVAFGISRNMVTRIANNKVWRTVQ